jgi:hypothetical protein
LVNAPDHFTKDLGVLPTGVEIVKQRRAPLDLILFFVKSEKELLTQFEKLAALLNPAGMLWISWPKKSSRVTTDLTEGVVQRIGLESGLVDTKVCAINDVWSGLRFVKRLKDRI